MNLAIRRYKVNAGAAEEVAKRAQAGFLPIISGAPGFLGYYLVNAGNDVVATVSIFETAAQAEGSVKMAADWVKENLAALVSAPPEVTTGEVAFHKTK